MWELRNRLSHGRISARRFSLLVTTAILTFFVAAFTLAPAAHADEATRDGDSIVYRGNTYSVATADQIPRDIIAQAPSTEGYRYIDTAAGKAHFVLTSGGAGQANSGYYVIYDFTPPANYSNPSPPTDVTITGSADDGEQAKENVSSCDGATLGGIGWIVCPTVNFIAKGMDKIYSIISEFLVVKTVTANTNTSLYQLWMVIRDVANICFVIAILVIVYSQLTSVGISNYGIKKTLPRLVIAAILVNVSYWICAVAVDASNILGYAIHSLFVSIMDRFSVGANYTGSIPAWEQVAAIALAGTGAAAAGVFVLANSVSGAIFLLLPLLVSAICAALVALIVLATRQALITILIILSPLAFVAYVLPNTEKYFTKWREAFTTLLLLFPIFSVIFSGAQLAGMAIIQSAGGNLFTIILGLGVQVAPIVITPMLVKFSGSIIGRVAGMLNNPNKGVVDRTRNWAQGAAAERKNKILADQNRLAKSRRFGALNNNPLTKGTKAINNRRKYVEGRRKAYEAAADNAFSGSRRGQDVEAMNRDNTNEKQRIDNRFADSDRGRRLEIQSRNLGVEKQEIENSMLRSADGHQLTYRQQMAEADKTRVHNEFEESHLGHQADTTKRTVEMEKKRIENTHQAEWDNAVRTDAGLYNLNLSVKASEAKAAVAKAKLEKVDAEVVAQGNSSEHILNLRGVDMQTQAGMLNIAHDLRRDTLEASVTATAKEMAERVTAGYKKDALKDNVITIDGQTIVEYAGGIKGQSGRNAVLAKVKSEQSAILMEDIKNIQSTMDYELSTDNNKLYAKLKATDDLAEKIAYTKAMAKNGGPGVSKLRKVLSELGDDGGKLVGKDDLLAFKEILATESGIMSAGKDIEFYLTNSAHFDASGNIVVKPDGKPSYKTFNELAYDMGTWKNLSPAAFASQNASTQFFALEQLHNNDHAAYMRIIDGIRTNPGALGQVKQGVIDKFSIYSDAVVAAMKKQGLNPTIGEMK